MRWAIAVVLAASGACAGCGQRELTCPRVIYLDGAGWFTGDKSVRTGLRDAGYAGAFERFGWSTGIAPLDHALAGPDHPAAEALCQRLTALRRANGDGRIVLIGLSSGCTIVLSALEKLAPGVSVDSVVLLSASTSSHMDLREALSHVSDSLYVTISPRDPLLAVGDSSGEGGGEPAGRVGFQPDWDVQWDEGAAGYAKIINIPWKPEYSALGWDGGHVSATASRFIQKVIAPKVLGP